MSILYVKGMNMMESEGSEDEDIWDDTKLNKAYDKAVSMANTEIAKRIAMSTNNKKKTDVKAEQASPKQSRSSSSHNAESSGHGQPPPTSMWKAGMACRATYDYDGVEYEAFILRVINDNECVVRFLGYENSEVVSISTLKPSLGKELRAKQIQDALAETTLCDEEEVKDCDEDVEMNNYAASYKETQQSSRDKEDKKKKKHSKRHHSDLPEMPFQMPNMANFMENGMEFPIPPPPVTLLQSAGPSSEDQVMSSMLLSWYMSGYCTGYYQGMKKSQSSRRKHH